MTSNIFSRLGQAAQDRSYYEKLRGGHDSYDVEGRAGLDEENINHQFNDFDLEHPEGLGIDGSRVTVDSVGPREVSKAPQHGRGGPVSRWLAADDDGDNDVPESLLVEPVDAVPSQAPTHRGMQRSSRDTAVPGPSSQRIQAQWKAVKDQQRLHNEESHGLPPNPLDGRQPWSWMTNLGSGDPREKALWRWVNVSNLDVFIRDVYDYYQGNGIWSILTERCLHLV